MGLKILHINSYYIGNKLYKNLFDQQMNSDLDISVYVPHSTSYRGSQDGFGEYTTLSPVFNDFDRLIFQLKHARILQDVKSKYKMDEYSVIHAHSLFSNGYIAMKLNQQFKIPYIVTVTNTDIHVFFKYMIHLRKMGIQILNNAQRVIFLSSGYRDTLLREYVPENLKTRILQKSVIIPNGVDEYWLQNQFEPKIIQHPDHVKLLYVGTVNKNKNITTTVKAMDCLSDRKIKATLTMVGRVESKGLFERLIKSKKVDYITRQSKEELIKIYRQHDILVMPSIHETFGLVYAEAMSQGLPVIYTRGQGFDRQFADGVVGYSANCFDASEIATAIQKVVNNYPEFSRNCIENSRVFDWRTIAQTYTKVLKASEKP